MNIKQFFDDISKFTSINFFGKESEMGLLAQKYDKTHNSIFEADELQAIKVDLQNFAKADGNENDLSNAEARNFLTSLFTDVAQGEIAIPEEESEEETVNLLFNLVRTGKENFKRELINNRLNEIGNKRTLSEDEINRLIEELNDEQFQRALELLYIEGRGIKNRLENNSGTRLEENETGNLPQMSTDSEGDSIKRTRGNRAKNYVESEEDISNELTASVPAHCQFSVSGIINLAQLDEDQFEKARTLFYINGREPQLNSEEIFLIAQLDDKFELAMQLINVDDGERQLNGEEIEILVYHLDNDALRRAKTLFRVENREEQFNVREILALLGLKPEEFERAQTLFHVDNIAKQFSGTEIAALAKLSPEEFERAEELFQYRDLPIATGQNIAVLAKMDDEDIVWVIKYLSDKSYNPEILTAFINCRCAEVETLLEQDMISNVRYVSPNSIKLALKDDNDLDTNNKTSSQTVRHNNWYVYDKTGLIETISFQEDITLDYELLQYTTFNTSLNAQYSAKFETPNIPYAPRRLMDETLTYFDSEGNVIRTVTTRRNPETGFLNVSDTDRDGNHQWQSIDPDTGAQLTERHLISPERVRTDYYAEELEDFRLSEYKITDKDGNVLISISQTFEQDPENPNKFISSVCTTGNPEDTHIYEMEYTEDNRVIIFDKTNNQTTEIDLKEYFHSQEAIDNIMPLIKQFPGQVLLEFAEKPFDFRYNGNEQLGMFWNPMIGYLKMSSVNGSEDADRNSFAMLLHELGHYLDMYKIEPGILSTNADIQRIYHEELEAFRANVTTVQQDHIGYFLGIELDTLNESYGIEEQVAETHSMMYSVDNSVANERRLYLAQYFPRTIAAIMKLLLEEEGVPV